MIHPFLRKVFSVFIYIFATIGLVFGMVFVGMQFGLLNIRGSIAERNAFFNAPATSTSGGAVQSNDGAYCVGSATTCAWNETREWQVVSGGLLKDKSVMHKVSGETGVPTRLLAALVIPEQTRFFTSEREVFKRYFEPLKILGSMSQFSLGISGIKPDTALKVEEYANATSSPFYPGDGYAELLKYKNGPSDSQRYSRLTDPKDHYYSYLYTAIYIKEIEAQWKNAGFDISQRPEILSTLFNLGFVKSKPHIGATVGGAPITTGGNVYSYGQLGELFYNSDELLGELPRK